MAKESVDNDTTKIQAQHNDIARRLQAAKSYGDFPILLTFVVLLASAGAIISYEALGTAFGALAGLLLGLWVNSAIGRAVRALTDMIKVQGQVLSDLQSQSDQGQ